MEDLFLQRTIDLALRGKNYTFPNPRVGALLASSSGILLSEGWHQKFGEPHAEVNAIANAPPGTDFSQTELYVSLEPCCHTNKKTPPCTNLILDKKIPKVIVGSLDPNPNVSGKGVEILRNAGVEVQIANNSERFLAINRAFAKNQILKKTYVTLKWATSKNGIIGDLHKRLMISDPHLQFWTHQLRSEHQAILVGKNTVLTDNPKLDCRYGLGKNPVIILMDSKNEISLEKYWNQERDVILVNTKKEVSEGKVKRMKVGTMDNWNEILTKLYVDFQISNVLIEGGASILQSVINSGEWDQTFMIQTENFIQTENPILSPKISVNFRELFRAYGNSVLFAKNNNSCY